MSERNPFANADLDSVYETQESSRELRRLAAWFYHVESDELPGSPREIVDDVIERMQEYRKEIAPLWELSPSEMQTFVEVMSLGPSALPCS